ncbi:MAG: energy-coupling factor ABC transporter ATP-binding protein [Clostridiales bacterium]|nr:energy-coupling factor ABC transporter ATP-binding protein [Clostridiales bacterium]
MIRFEQVTFAYPNRQDFRLTVDFFASGACTALLGENGSGKTTFGKLAAGILKPDTGRILYDGQDIAGLKLGEIGRQAGYLFQEPARQIFAARPLEEIAFPLELRGMAKPEAEQKARALCEEFELNDTLDQTTYTLSRGEKQRLALAAIMACEPRFLVLDEPTTGLDRRRRELLAATLRRLLARDLGLLVITHDRTFAESLGADPRFIKEGVLLDG